MIDFGLASITRDPSSVASEINNHGHTPRWTAPEILREGILASKESDIFALGMVIYEVRRRSASVVPTALPFGGGFRRERSVSQRLGAGGSGQYHGREASRAAYQPQTDGSLVGIS
jgi:serine/threonine protein kinase